MLDRRIVALLNERARLAREAGRAKAEAGRTRHPRCRAGARDPAARVDGQRGTAAPGRSPRAVPTPVRRDAGAGGARPRARPGGSRRGRERRLERLVSWTARTATATLTRFAPAPTGYLHLGHVANAVWTWGLAASRGARVLLRIEDHDRQRCRPEFDEALLEDLDWLGFRADVGPVRQSDPEAGAAYRAALEVLLAGGLVYGCDCTRSTFSAWAAANGRAWSGAGCPGGCRDRRLDRTRPAGSARRWARILDRRAGRLVRGRRRAAGDLPIRDRHGNWTYGFCVVVDDARQGVDLVVRGRDLLDATATRSGWRGLLGRTTPATFAHHPLVLRPDGGSCRSRRATPASVSCESPGGSGGGHETAASPAATGRDGRLAGSTAVRRAHQRGLRSVLHLPRVVEGVPRDAPCGIAQRPLPVRERTAIGRLAEQTRGRRHAPPRSMHDRRSAAPSSGCRSRGRRRGPPR